MSMRIQASHTTVKALQCRLQDAYRRDDVRLVRRISVLLALLTQQATVLVLCERWGLSPACLYAWQKAFILRGLDSLVYRHGGGRPEKLTSKQKQRLVELIEAGPLVVGCETACWNGVLIRVLIWREFGVLYNRQYICTLLHNLGFSFQKARFVSDHLDTAKRLAWLTEKWPTILRAAKRCHAAVAEWRAAPSTDNAQAVIDALGSIVEPLRPHLVEEETVLLPIAAKWITPEEWARLPGHAMASFGADKPWLALGLVREQLDQERPRRHAGRHAPRDADNVDRADGTGVQRLHCRSTSVDLRSASCSRPVGAGGQRGGLD